MPHGIIYKENKLTLATNKIGSTLMRAQVVKLTLATNNVNTIYLVEIM